MSKADEPAPRRDSAAATQTYGFQDEAATPDESALPASAPRRPLGPVLGRFGDFEILEEVGRGSMGVVFRARQVSLDRIVALKMVWPERLRTPELAARFRQQAEGAARLDYSGIVRVFEVGACAGHLYVAMAFVEGESLAARLERGPLPPREAATLLREIADALQHGHDQGVSHRDLHAANILIATDGKPRLTGFGLGGFPEGASPGAGVGAAARFAYLAPEQATGGSVGPAADIFALGSLLYALLTGVPPFRAASIEELLRFLRDSDPVPPSDLNRRVDRDLETICLKCLEKEPRQRYRRPLDLMADVMRWLNRRPIKARAGTVLRRSWLWCRRDPQAAALALVVLAGLVGPALWNWGREAARNAEAWEVVERPGGAPEDCAAAARRLEKVYLQSRDNPEARIRLGVARLREGTFAEASNLLLIGDWRAPESERTQKLHRQAAWYASLAHYRGGNVEHALSGMALLRGPLLGTEAEELVADSAALLRWLDSVPTHAPFVPLPPPKRDDEMDFEPHIPRAVTRFPPALARKLFHRVLHDHVLHDDDIGWIFQQLGERVLKIVPDLCQRETHDNHRVRQLAQHVLVDAVLTPQLIASEPGRQVLSRVVKALTDTGGTPLRMETLLPRLGALGSKARPALPALLDIYLRKNVKTSADVKRALDQIDPGWTDSAEARRRLAQLAANLEQGTDTERQYAVAVLPRLGKAALPVLIKLMESGQPVMRGPALTALGKIAAQGEGDAALLFPALVKVLRDPDSSLHAEAGDTLFQLGPDVVPMVVEHMNTEKAAALRYTYWQALARVGPPARAAAGALIKALDEPAPEARIMVARALANVSPDDPDAQAAMARLARDAHADVRKVARAVLEQMRSSSGNNYFHIRGVLTPSDPLDRHNNGRHHAVHTCFLNAGPKYRIGLNASWANSLRLESPHGKVLGTASGHPDSSLELSVLHDGWYRIVVTSQGSEPSQEYTLTAAVR